VVPDRFDLVVVGGGPAGATAAARAAREGATVAVIERARVPRPRRCTGWLGPAGVAMCADIGLVARKAGARPFSSVRLHSWDLQRSAHIEDPELRGWLIDRGPFDDAVLDCATSAGAHTITGVEVADIHLGEDEAAAHLRDGRRVVGRIMLIADGVHSPVGQRAGLTPAIGVPRLPCCAFVEFTSRSKGVGLEIAVGASRSGQVVTVMRAGNGGRVSLMMRGEPAEVRSAFVAFNTAAAHKGLLPDDLPAPRMRLSPAGAALDLETHVGKRCVLIGDAGGFVAAFSNEGIYPAMRSGWIAAEVALRALAAAVPQDELATFGPQWRRELADYLRMPNTDLSLLVPLVFNNEQMSRRVVRSFLLGQPF